MDHMHPARRRAAGQKIKDENLLRIFNNALRSVIPTNSQCRGKSSIHKDHPLKTSIDRDGTKHLCRKEPVKMAKELSGPRGMNYVSPKQEMKHRTNESADSGYSSLSPENLFALSDVQSNSIVQTSSNQKSHAAAVGCFSRSSSSPVYPENVISSSANASSTPQLMNPSTYQSLVSESSYMQVKSNFAPSGYSHNNIFTRETNYSGSPCSIKPPVPRIERDAMKGQYHPLPLVAYDSEDDSDELPWDSSESSGCNINNSFNYELSKVTTPSFPHSFNRKSGILHEVYSPKRKFWEVKEESKKVRTTSICSTDGQERIKANDSMSRSESPKESKYKSRSLMRNDECGSSSRKRSSYSTPKQRILSPSCKHYSPRSSVDQTPSPLESPDSGFFRSHCQSNDFPSSCRTSKFKNLCTTVGFIDTHCHLDFLFKRANHDGSYAAYRQMLKEYFPVNYEGCVAVFCSPASFDQKWFWGPLIEEDGVWAAFGCHPHNAKYYSEEIDEALLNALKHIKVKALGEIGLDYSVRNNCNKYMQQKVFRRQLKIAIDMKLPLVIHCREAEAHEDCFKIMKEIVPHDHPIHLHCFTDCWELASMWLDGFPNLFIGITNLVTFPSATCVHEVVKNIPLDRLLLETDTPYFLPKTLPKSLKWSHPGMAIYVAVEVSAIKETVTVEEVLRVVRGNTKLMYKI